ncbi:MAG: hypothetical protein K2M17_00340 [Bacilli bacterium]|nr:hypothetical protein [Bacilli bacterium]
MNGLDTAVEKIKVAAKPQRDLQSVVEKLSRPITIKFKGVDAMRNQAKAISEMTNSANIKEFIATQAPVGN